MIDKANKIIKKKRGDRDWLTQAKHNTHTAMDDDDDDVCDWFIYYIQLIGRNECATCHFDGWMAVCGPCME